MRTHGGVRSVLSSLVAVTLVSAGLTVAAAAPAIAAEPAPAISVDKLLSQQLDDPTVDNSILIGDSVEYTVRVSNSGAAGVGRGYNISVRDVLPEGVAYEAGSSSLAEPTVIVDKPAAGQTTLVWTNLFDLNPADERDLTYSVTPDPDALPVGSTFTNSATAYATNDPFDVTNFTAAGTCESSCAFSATDTIGTLVNAIAVRKDEPSPENELVRGVHDNSTVYTLTIRNNSVAPTNAVTLIDYIPAALEFLGCGGVDNTTLGVEYDGADALTVVPSAGADCVQPASVATISTDPPGPAPAGLYTRVRWNAIDLAIGETRTVTYRAGIPLFANTLDWAGLTPPLISTNKQAANLDNNNGASTAELPSESSLRNYVSATGRYQGPNATGQNPATVTTYNSETVVVEDLAIRKTVTPGVFSIGRQAQYTITARTSEYRTTSGLTLVDNLPDGLVFDAGSAAAALDGSTIPVSVTASAYGPSPQVLTFSVTLPGGVLPTNADLVVTFTATEQAEYASGAPTAVGDTYRNTVTATGTTSPAVCPNAPPGPDGAGDCIGNPQPDYAVQDASTADIVSSSARIDKKVGQDPASDNCMTQAYDDAVPAPPFQLGDIICFELTAELSSITDLASVLSPTIRDFLPPDIAFVPLSATYGPDNNLLPSEIAFDGSSAPLSGGGSVLWTLGTVDPQATNPGQLVVGPRPGGVPPVFQVRFAAVVVSTVLDQNVDITGNLMKSGAVNSAGEALTGRDQVDFEIAGSQVDVTKGVQEVARAGSTVAGPFAANTDHIEVRGGDIVTFRVDVTNTGTSGAGSDVPVRRVRVTDVLPSPFTCADVDAASVSDGGVCPVPGSTLVWEYDGTPETDVAIAAGEAETLTYDITVPTTVLVDTDYVNTATVTDYQSLTNLGWTDNQPVDVTDPSDVFTANVGIAKSGVTSFDSTNNNALTQFTVGEEITYTVDATVPAGTSLPAGARLRDPVPSALRYVSGSAEATYEGVALPDGVTFSDAGGVMLLSFPAGFENPSIETAAAFRITFTAVVLGSTYTHNQQITNTATFSGAGFTKQASKSARVVIPNPTIDKSHTPAGLVEPGDDLTYTLTVTNPNPVSGLPRPISFNTFVVDCLPAGMSVVSAGTGTVESPSTLGCAAGETPIRFDVGDVDPQASVPLTYVAEIDLGEPAGATFANRATVTGYSLPDTVQPDAALKGTYTDTAVDTVTVVNGVIAKSVDPQSAAAGQTVEYTIVATYLDTSGYPGAVITDAVPSGIDIDSIALVGPITCTGDAVGCQTLADAGTFGDPLPVSGRTVGWNVGDVPDSEQDVVVTVRYRATVQSGVSLQPGDLLVNTATSTWTTGSESATSDVVASRPQLSIAKDVSTTTPTPGAAYTYAVVVSNDVGDTISPAFDVTVEDSIPSGVIVDAGAISDGGLVSGADPVSGGGTITWVLAGPIGPGASVTLTYGARLQSSLTEGDFVNTVDITDYTSCTAGFDSGDGFACGATGDRFDDVTPAEALVTVGDPSADLSIVKEPVSANSTAGSRHAFTMSVRNLGPSDAQGAIEVRDTLPAGLTYVSSIGAWSCAPAGQLVTCTLEPLTPAAGLAAGDDAPALTIIVQIQSQPLEASYGNIATVESTTTADPNLANNTSTATVTVFPQAPPVDPDPEKPVDPPVVIPPDPDEPVDPDKPITPVKPSVIPQKPVTPINPPTTIKPGKPTVVFPGTVTTNAGQPVTAAVSCRPLRLSVEKMALTLDGRWVPMGQVSYCKVRTTKKGKVTVTVTYPGPVLVKVVYTATKVPGYTAFTKVKRWVVVPR